MKERIKTISIIVLSIVATVLLVMQGCVRNSNRNLDKNIKALTDSMQVLKTKNGELVYARQALILEKKDLEKYLDISRKEIKELEKILDDKLSYIAKLEGQIKIDTLICHDTVIHEKDITSISFKYDDIFLNLDGCTTHDKISDCWRTQINNISMSVPLQVGLTDNYRIFVKTPNPYVSFTDIEGAVIEKTSNGSKPKRWNLGVQVGVGAGYDLLHRNISVGPYIGVGIAYGFDF